MRADVERPSVDHPRRRRGSAAAGWVSGVRAPRVRHADVEVTRFSTTPGHTGTRRLKSPTDKNQGALQPANAPAGVCSCCLKQQAITGQTPGKAGVDATTAPAATGSGHPPKPTHCDSVATGAHTAGPVAGAAPSPVDSTGDWTPDPYEPTRADDGHGATRDLPLGATVRYFGDYEIQ
jgi:hypothetical protein